MPDEERKKPTTIEQTALREAFSSQDFYTFSQNKDDSQTEPGQEDLLVNSDEELGLTPASSSQQQSDDLLAVLVLLASCFLFTMMSCLVRYLLQFFHIPVFYITFYCGVATVLMCQVTLFAVGHPVTTTSCTKSTLLLHARCIFGALALLFSYAALQRLPVGIFTCLNSMTPIITTIMGCMLLNEQLTALNYVVLCVVTAGAILVGISEPTDVSNVSGSARIHGVIFCFLTAVSSACLFVSMRHLGSEASVVGTEYISSIWCTILMLMLYMVQYGILGTPAYLIEQTVKLSGRAHAALTGIAFCNFAASILLNYGTREVRADKSAIVMTSEIPMGFAIAFVMLGEYPTSVLEISGCILTAIGTYTIAMWGNG